MWLRTLRYKQGKNLNFEAGKVLKLENPEDAKLPKLNVSSSYVFAVEDYFFAYPNNYNYYVNFYKDTFQHGGVSLEEMIVPYRSSIAKIIRFDSVFIFPNEIDSAAKSLLI